MLITEEYRALQTKLHQDNAEYGSASLFFAPAVSAVINKFQVDDVIDYGCGKGRLSKALLVDHDVRMTLYDPSIEEWADRPEPAQMLVCLDVLEHIEPELLDSVLDDMKSLMLEIGFFSVHTGPAKKFLSDGRNAHLIQEPPSWWLPKIESRFEVMMCKDVINGFVVMVKTRGE